MTEPAATAERNYPMPLPASGDDPNFNFELIYDVAKVLEAHGFPPVTSRDHVYLSLQLFQFMYRGD